MSTRFDLLLQKHPDQEEGIRLLASRDPSGGRLKYLDWGAKVLVSGQALAPEVADIIDLFHQFAGRRLEPRRTGRGPRRTSHRVASTQRVHPDIHTYRPGDLAKLHELLLKIKRATDRKRREREKLYRIEGSIEADVVYDGPDLIVRHIKNKQASVHYGHNTKWCISMLREGYFEDYETQNATFFFFERKAPKGDEYDKVALMLARCDNDNDDQRLNQQAAFTALDRQVDMMVLAKVHGPQVFDIFRQVHEASEQYPGSGLSCVYSGVATEEQLVAALATIKKMAPYEVHALLEAVCCNDAATWPLLEEIWRSAYKVALASWKPGGARFHGRHRRRALRRGKDAARALERTVMAALLVHPNAPVDVREKLTKDLRRRHVNVYAIRRTKSGGRVGISYENPVRGFGGRRRYRHARRFRTPKLLRERAAMMDRAAKRIRKSARTLERKLAEKKRRKLKAETKKKLRTRHR